MKYQVLFRVFNFFNRGKKGSCYYLYTIVHLFTRDVSFIILLKNSHKIAFHLWQLIQLSEAESRQEYKNLKLDI